MVTKHKYDKTRSLLYSSSITNSLLLPLLKKELSAVIMLEKLQRMKPVEQNVHQLIDVICYAAFVHQYYH